MKIMFSSGDKGGVGKSFLAKALVDFCLRYSRQVLPIDADPRNADLFQLTDGLVPTLRVNLRNEDGWAELVNHVEKAKADSKGGGVDSIVSMPAGIGEEDECYGGLFARAVKEIGATVDVFWVINHEAESVKLLKHMLETGGYLPNQITVVQNKFFGNDFGIWEGSNTRKVFLEAGGREVFMPALSPRVTGVMVTENVLFSQALTRLGVYDRIVLQTWFEEFDAIFAPLLGGKP